MRPILSLLQHVGAPAVGQKIQPAWCQYRGHTCFYSSHEATGPGVAIAFEQIFNDTASADVNHSLENPVTDHFLHGLVALALSVADNRRETGCFQQADCGLNCHLGKPEG